MVVPAYTYTKKILSQTNVLSFGGKFKKINSAEKSNEVSETKALSGHSYSEISGLKPIFN